LAVEGITDRPNRESQTARKPACTPGFLAKSITCSGQIIAIDQSLPNSSRTTMKLPRRRFLHLAAGAAALPATSRIAWAQAYPSPPVRIVLPFAPGGVNDITARLIGQLLTERLGQQFLIENRTGGGGNIGIEAVVRSPADGYTLLVVGTTAAINATLFEKL